MELKELCERTMRLFNVENISDLKEELYKSVIQNDINKFRKFKEMVNDDLSIDWLQKIFQYYEADRKEKKQDYTPVSIAKFVGKLSKNQNIIDMCAGSGSLTIQKWNLDHDCKFKLYEFDENVIPYLLFNLAIRNIEASVFQMDVLSQEILKKYRIIKGQEFSSIEVVK